MNTMMNAANLCGVSDADIYFKAVVVGNSVVTENGYWCAAAEETARNEYNRPLTCTWRQVASAGISIFSAQNVWLFCYLDSAQAAGFDVLNLAMLDEVKA